MTSDPQPGSWLHSQIKRDVIDQGRRQRATWAAWDRKLADSQARIDALLQAELEAAREQAAAQVVDERPDGQPVGDPAGETVPPPAAASIDELAASAPIGSPDQHMAWRRQHVNADRGIFGR